MAYTDEELQIFAHCFKLLDDGCTMSSQMEKALVHKFWWISNTSAYLIVRKWFRNREKIEEILAQQNLYNHSNNEPCHRIPCETSS